MRLVGGRIGLWSGSASIGNLRRSRLEANLHSGKEGIVFPIWVGLEADFLGLRLSVFHIVVGCGGAREIGALEDVEVERLLGS